MVSSLDLTLRVMFMAHIASRRTFFGRGHCPISLAGAKFVYGHQVKFLNNKKLLLYEKVLTMTKITIG